MSGDLSLGGAASGSAGSISFSSGTISPDLFTPAALNYESVSPDVEVIRDAGTQALRQIKAPEVLVDIITLSATSYEVKFYSSAQVGLKTAGIYSVTGNPTHSWRVSSPTNSASTPTIMVTEILGTVQTNQIFSYSGGTWMAQISGFRSETRTETLLANGDSQIDTTVSYPASGLIVSNMRNIYHAFPWGTEKISSVQDPGGDSLKTTWAFHGNSSDADNYGHLQSLINPDGSWERYDYYGAAPNYSSGKIHHTYRPWKNLPALPTDANISNCHLTTYEYTSLSISGSYFEASELSSVEKKVLGVVVEKKLIYPSNSVLTSSTNPLFDGFPTMVNLPIILRIERDSLHGRQTATLATTSQVPNYLKGRLAYIQEPDGRQEIHTYGLGTSQSSHSLSRAVWEA